MKIYSSWAFFKTLFMNGIHTMKYIWGFNPLTFCLYKLFQICCSKWTYFTETRGTFSLRLCIRPQWPLWQWPRNGMLSLNHIVPLECIHCFGIMFTLLCYLLCRKMMVCDVLLLFLRMRPFAHGILPVFRLRTIDTKAFRNLSTKS